MTVIVVIVYHSGYGHTKKQAEAVHAGVQVTAEAQSALLAIDAEGNLPDGAWGSHP